VFKCEYSRGAGLPDVLLALDEAFQGIEPEARLAQTNHSDRVVLRATDVVEDVHLSLPQLLLTKISVSKNNTQFRAFSSIERGDGSR
jgi:hypothetical protein